MDIFRFMQQVRYAGPLTTIPPLPVGEGRGEGNFGNTCRNLKRTSITR